MLLKNDTLDAIIAGDVSVVFRTWKRPTVKTGGTLKTRKGVLAIEKVEIVDRSKVSAADIRRAGLGSREELCESGREGDFYKITVRYAGEDPRIALRRNLEPDQLRAVCAKLDKMGDWAGEYLLMIGERPNTHAQILADAVGLEKLKFKARVRRLKTLGLTESLRPGYKLSPRGEKVAAMIKRKN